MANRKVTTSRDHERALLVLLKEHNARIAASIPPGRQLTDDEFFEVLAQPMLDDILRRGNVTTSEDIIKALRVAIESGNDAKINAVKAALGL